MQTSGRFGTMNQRRGSAATELYDIEDPGPNDVLFGRGTGSNMHAGNIRFRALIQQYKPVYRDTPKKMKPSVSTKVVAIWRSQNPPGRFLTRSDRFHGSRRTFYDVGDAMARRKAAQCLREKSSKERIMQQKDEEKCPNEDSNEETETPGISDTVESSDAKLQDEELEFVPGLGGALRAAKIEDALGACSAPEEQISSFELQPNSIESSSKEMNVMIQEALSSESTERISASPMFTKPKLSQDVPSKLPPSTMKGKLYKESQGSFGSLKDDPMSLVDTYASKLDDRDESSDSPFMFASFGFEKANQDNDSEGGLCFPSLFGADSGNTSSDIFDDDNSSSSLFGGGSSAASLFDEPEETVSFPPLFPPTAPPTKKKEALQNIRDSMPTAASLTSNLFDW